MGILTSQDKEKIKRVIPLTNNKIIDATVARLYIAYPDPTSWVYTDLVGAIVFVDDLVGHTFFLKMVDIIGNRGVIWDQELYIDFDYNQDRTFFHTFELEDCLAGLLFEDTSEATHFFKRVSARKKYGSKKTVNNKTAIAMKKTQRSDEPMRPGPRGEYVDVNTAQRSRRSKGILYYDDEPPPEWKPLYAELAAAGITEDMIADNREFIKSYIAQQGGPLVGLEPPIPRLLSQPISKTQPTSRISSASSLRSSKKAPPPPPLSYEKPSLNSLSTHANATSHSADSGRSTPSADDSLSADSHEPSPEPKSLETFKPVFRVPPSNAAIPNTNGHMVSGSSQQPTELPPSQETKNNPPPLPLHSRPLPSTPGRVHNVPPPPPSRSMVQPPAPPPRASNGPPPPAPPRRGGVPPPPPPRALRGPPPPLPPSRSGFKSSTVPETYVNNNTPPAAQRIPPPLPKHGTGLAPSAPDAASPPPTIPARLSVQSQAQPPVQALKVSSSPVPPPPPPAPPAPMMQSPSTVQRATGGIPPPPPPGPPPPTSASSDSGSTPPLPQPDGSRDALLASIRGAGGIGSLKKTDKSQIDKPSVILQEAHGETPVSSNPGGGSQAGGPPGSLADALASALNKRKDKIAKSDDEEDEDW